MKTIALIALLILLIHVRDEQVRNSAFADTVAWLSIVAVSILLLGQCVP